MAWLEIEGPNTGGDTNEDALDALIAASQMSSGSYIALATDAGFHYSGDTSDPDSDGDHPGSDCTCTQLTAQQAHDILATAGCKVYIDAGNLVDNNGDQSWEHYTAPNPVLHVNGQMEDWDVPASERFKFPRLQAAIIAE